MFRAGVRGIEVGAVLYRANCMVWNLDTETMEEWVASRLEGGMEVDGGVCEYRLGKSILNAYGDYARFRG